MIAAMQRYGLFLVGALIGGLFGYWTFVVQDDAWYRFDWRKVVIPPAFVLGMFAGWLGHKPIPGRWCWIAGGMIAGGIILLLSSVIVSNLVVNLVEFEWEHGNMIKFFATVTGLPLGMLVGGLFGGHLGKSLTKQHEKSHNRGVSM